MNHASLATLAILSAAGQSLSIGAQPPAAEPSAQSASVQPAAAPAPASTDPAVAATVLEVVGLVQWRPAPDAPLRAAAVGDQLPPGSEIFTGHRSRTQIRLHGTQIFIIERLARVRLSEVIAATNASPATTRVDLPYGRVDFKVVSTRVSNDVRIKTPDAILAVKGTTGFINVQFGRTEAGGGVDNTGNFTVTYENGQEGNIEDQNQTDSQDPNPADKENRNNQPFLPLNVLTPEEIEALRRNTGGGSNNLNFNNPPTPGPSNNPPDERDGKGYGGPSS